LSAILGITAFFILDNLDKSLRQFNHNKQDAFFQGKMQR